jgi:hypothetical protein
MHCSSLTHPRFRCSKPPLNAISSHSQSVYLLHTYRTARALCQSQRFFFRGSASHVLRSSHPISLFVFGILLILWGCSQNCSAWMTPTYIPLSPATGLSMPRWAEVEHVEFWVLSSSIFLEALLWIFATVGWLSDWSQWMLAIARAESFVLQFVIHKFKY